MKGSELQNDFFTGHDPKKKNRKTGLINDYLERRSLPHIRIPVEHAVIMAIGIMVLMLISYSVGVEMGKRGGDTGAQTTSETPVIPQIAAEETFEEGFVDEERVTAIELCVSVDLSDEKEDVASTPDEEFSIQLASFKNPKSAEKEVKELIRNGFKGAYVKKGSWYQVYSSGYHTIDEAREAMDLLSSEYSDCFIRRLK